MRCLLALLVCLAGTAAISAPAPFARPIKLPHVLRGHTDDVYGIAFNRDGTTLASVSDDKTVKLWDVKTGKQTAVILNVHPPLCGSVSFSPDGKTLASYGSDDKTIALRSVKNGKTTLTLQGSSKVHSFAFSPDGMTLASAMPRPHDKNLGCQECQANRHPQGAH